MNTSIRSKPPAVRGRTSAPLVQIGTEIVSERDFTCTGIDSVLKRAGVPKGSFYHYFKSKDDRGAALAAAARLPAGQVHCRMVVDVNR